MTTFRHDMSNSTTWHELADRTHIALDFINEKIYDHPALLTNGEFDDILRELRDITDGLDELYQKFGQLMNQAMDRESK